MRDRDFAREIRTKNRTLYIELEYRQRLIGFENRYRDQLDQIQELLDSVPPTQIAIVTSLLDLKNNIEWELQGIDNDIHQCTQRIKNQRTICKITIPLG